MSWITQIMNGLSGGGAGAAREQLRPQFLPSVQAMIARAGANHSNDESSSGHVSASHVASILQQLRMPRVEETTGGLSDVRAAAFAIQPEVRVYDGSQHDEFGRARYVGNGSALRGASQDAIVAAHHAHRALAYYQTTFGRSGVDGSGRSLDIVLNDQSRDHNGQELFRGNGGYYTTRDSQGNISEAIRWGSGTAYQHRRGGWVEQRPMLYADDLTIHELTHGVLKAETGSLGGTADQTGAVHEAFADVMAAAATRDWRIGEGMYTARSTFRYMRNIASPDDPRAVHSVWRTMSQYRAAERSGSVDEHHASGILSHAAATMQQQIGGDRGWRAVEQVFYRTLDTGRLGDLSFAAAAHGLRISADELFGMGSLEQQALETALRQAGL